MYVENGGKEAPLPAPEAILRHPLIIDKLLPSSNTALLRHSDFSESHSDSNGRPDLCKSYVDQR